VSQRPWHQAAILAGITLLVFAPTLSAGFVYDARLQILTDPFLHDPRNWWPVLSFGVLSMDVLDFNRPVHLASLMLDAAVWGKEPFGYHLTSVAIHALNVVLVWAVLRGLSPGVRLGASINPAIQALSASEGIPRRKPRTRHHLQPADASASGSPGFRPGLPGEAALILPPLLFAVHPLVTEAVCEPTFREDLLVAFFTLAGLLLAMGHSPQAARDPWRALGCVACSLLAIASKESGIAAPAVIGLYWLLYRRGEQGSFWSAAIGGAKLVVLLFLVARFLLEPSPSRIFEARPQYPGGSLWAALAIEPRILALYAQLILLPVKLCADYGLYSVRHLPLPVALAVVAALVAAAVLAIRSDRRMALAVALIVVPLLPVCNLVPIYRAAADRYLYLPLAGVALAVGLGFDGPWLATRPWLRERLLMAGLAAAMLLGLATTERQRVWASSLALWDDTVRKNPVAYTAASGLGEALREAGRLPEAEQAIREAIRLTDGKRGDAWATLALILDGQGRTADADAALDRAIEVDPKLADPEARVAALAMERSFADGLLKLQQRRDARR
jgi:protein O-mannosyl-transferase